MAINPPLRPTSVPHSRAAGICNPQSPNLVLMEQSIVTLAACVAAWEKLNARTLEPQEDDTPGIHAASASASRGELHSNCIGFRLEHETSDSERPEQRQAIEDLPACAHMHIAACVTCVRGTSLVRS